MLLSQHSLQTKLDWFDMKKWLELAQSKDKRPFIVRSQVIDTIRAYFKAAGFLEVETPLLVENPGTEPYLEVFKTTLKAESYPDTNGYLVTSPELFMKKLLAAGVGSIFQISKSFRNGEGISSFHNHEFTILEWYRVNADYTTVMSDCEGLLLAILRQVSGDPTATTCMYQGKKYDLSAPWERISVAQAFTKYVGVSTEELLDENALKEVALGKGYAVTATTTWEEVYNQLFLNEIEPNLGTSKPTIVYDYPASQAALSKRKATDPRFAERFEFYIGGLEMGNAFSELIDAKEQRQRMVDDLALRKKLGKYEYSLDEDFFTALEMGLPQTGGIAVGVDRLAMFFADVPSIRDVVFFPTSDTFSFQEK